MDLYFLTNKISIKRLETFISQTKSLEKVLNKKARKAYKEAATKKGLHNYREYRMMDRVVQITRRIGENLLDQYVYENHTHIN